ncbi:hypothetical protein [Antarcticimicrobium luteum]|uniref:SGNH/GDSL hydrolase family protein n=1 Tax=Antarcticimicrobium luteum TaxID=2547397 RepID=A0A4R5USX4_9RHOB|nr:hypothetical protein [Antarcticimicrobium luteum]TDK42131.1 hypothetical protein E1832_18465 [Antarcticimicrobium luteum]
MTLRLLVVLIAAALLLAGSVWWYMSKPRTPGAASVAAAYDTPLTPPPGPITVYHLGHSLVGRDMPAMLAQLAGPGHRYALQLGWGTTLKQHWEPDLEINGFEAENDTPQFRPARVAIGSGEYDAVVLTEMVELRDAIKYHDSARYLSQWADLARQAAPETRVYLYETWHRLDDPEGWLDRLDRDLEDLWENKVLLPDLAGGGAARPIHVIPAGQVMAAFVRAVEAAGGLDNIASRDDLFRRDEAGKRDDIHLNDLGHYLVALTHYAVLYGRNPQGLPRQLVRADGTAATAPGADSARLMQRIVWQVVTTYPKTGVAP